MQISNNGSGAAQLFAICRLTTGQSGKIAFDDHVQFTVQSKHLQKLVLKAEEKCCVCSYLAACNTIYQEQGSPNYGPRRHFANKGK